MKKIILALTALAIAFASCSNDTDTQLEFAALEALKASNLSATSGTGGTENPATPVATSGGATGTDVASGENGSSTTVTEPMIATPDVTTGTTIGGISIGADGTVTISSSKVVFIGDTAETIDGVEYKVKKYAQLIIDDNPYFYTYFKLYYLNDKLRRFYSFDHGIGCEMDYKYDEFREHYCSERFISTLIKIYTYYENGKLESYINPAAKYVYEYYSNGALKLYKMYSTNTIYLNNIEGAMYLSRKVTYTESGKEESSITYAADGVTETSKTLYTYYDNGNQKSYESYSNGLPTQKNTYYENGNIKTQEKYIDGKPSSKIAYYESGNPQKAESYSDGALTQVYTFHDQKTTTSTPIGEYYLYGQKESSITYAADGITETSKTLYTYYDNGNLKSYESYSNGLPTQKNTYYENGNIKTQEKYTDGKLSLKRAWLEDGKIESDITYAADGVTEASKTVCVYYDSGNPQKAESYSNGTLTQFYTFYDEKGTTSVSVGGYYFSGKIKIQEEYTEGKPSFKFAYYESGNPQKTESYYNDGKSTVIYTFYDEKGTTFVSGGSYYLSGKQKTYEKYIDGKLSYKRSYLEDDKTESIIDYEKDGVTEFKYLYTYYDNGNEKTEETYSNGTLSSKITRRENGKIESETTYAEDGVTETSKVVCTYYDSGNLQKAESYNNGTLTQFYTFYDEKGTTSETVGGYYLSGKIKTKEEYTDGKLSSKITYYENDKPESSITYAADGVTETEKMLCAYYDSGNPKKAELYSNGALTKIGTFYDEKSTTYYGSVGGCYLYGKLKTQEEYTDGKLSSKTTYTETDKTESIIEYAADGTTETKRKLYTFYDNGNQKSYESYNNGIKTSLGIYFDESPKKLKLEASFGSATGKVYSFTAYTTSGYCKYYYYNGDFYTYEDNKTKSPSTISSVYSTKQDYSLEQAEAMLTKMLNE